VEFMKEARHAYFCVASFVGRMTVIPPVSLEEAKREVLIALRRVLSGGKQTGANGMRAGSNLAAA
jgi:hypothetical protein